MLYFIVQFVKCRLSIFNSPTRCGAIGSPVAGKLTRISCELTRSSISGWMRGDVTAVGVVLMRGGWTQKSGKH
jgi:hypothetical protein